MLWTAGVIFVALWMIGIVRSITLGGFIHVLLVLAAISFVTELLWVGNYILYISLR